MTSFQRYVAHVRAKGAPLPLSGHAEALARAYVLRSSHGMAYSQIATVMGVYHGVWFSEDRWRHALRAEGVPATRSGFIRKGDTWKTAS